MIHIQGTANNRTKSEMLNFPECGLGILICTVGSKLRRTRPDQHDISNVEEVLSRLPICSAAEISLAGALPAPPLRTEPCCHPTLPLPWLRLLANAETAQATAPPNASPLISPIPTAALSLNRSERGARERSALCERALASLPTTPAPPGLVDGRATN